MFRFSNTLEGFEALSRWIGNIQVQRKKEKVIVGIEPTGHYWFVLGQYLQCKGIKLVMVNPYAVKQSKELDDNNQTKNDAKDPSVIAKLVIDGRYSIPYVPQTGRCIDSISSVLFGKRILTGEWRKRFGQAM